MKRFSNKKSDVIFKTFEKNKFKLIPHNLSLWRLMTKLMTSLTEAMVMFIKKRLVSWLERSLVLIKTNFCASCVTEHARRTLSFHSSITQRTRKNMLSSKDIFLSIYVILPYILNKFFIPVLCYIFGALFKLVYRIWWDRSLKGQLILY